MARLFQLLRAPSTTDTVLQSVVTDDTEWRAAKASIGKVLQPFQKGWTPKGVATMEPLTIKQFKMKVDAEEYPDDLEVTWLGFLADNDLDRKTWPFIRWFVETMLIPQAKEDYELDAIYFGKRKEPTAGTAGQTFEVMDGILHARNKAILDGKTSAIAIGAWDADDALLVDQFEEFVDTINKEYRNARMFLGVNEDIERRFYRGYRKKYGTHANFEDTKGVVDFSNIRLKGLPSMRGSDAIWATPIGNARRMLKKTQNMNNIRIENVDRLVKMFSDWFSGAGFVLGELIFTNDLDLGAPVIDSMTPLTAGTGGGDTITAEGREYTGVTGVTLGGTACTNIVITHDRKLSFDTPAKTAGTYSVVVTNAYGSTTADDQITVA